MRAGNLRASLPVGLASGHASDARIRRMARTHCCAHGRTHCSGRILALEHRIYPQAVRWFVEGRLSLVNGRVLVRDEPAEPRGWTVPPVEA